MPFIVISPPGTDEALAEEGKKILEAVASFGHSLNVEDFLHAWIRGIRVVAETDSSGKYIGIAFVMMGDRWLFNDKAVSVLLSFIEDKAGFIQFLRSIASAIGASKLIYEDRILEKTDTEITWAVKEITIG